MASSYVNDLRLNEMATGDASGTWGETTNTNLELIAEAFSYGTEAITTNADTHTTTIADGATDPGRSMYLKYTGTLDSACTITIGPNTVSKVWIIENGTSGSQDIILSQGSGANITIPAGDTKVVYSDGAGAGAAFFDAFASLSVVDLTATGIVTAAGTSVFTNLDISGDIDVDGTTNLDVVDIDGAVNMATTALVTGVLTTTAATVFNGGFASNAASTLTVTEGDHVNGLKLINSQAGGYGSALTFQSERSDNNAIVSAAQIRTQGQDSWNSEASADSNLFFATSLNGSLTDKMVIKHDGNVGIGTAAPESIVHIKDTGNVSTTLQIESAASQYVPVINFDGIVGASADYLLGEINGSWDTHTNVVSAIRFESGADTTNKDDGLISFWVSSSGPTLTECMRIASSGFVGIGTTSPARKLQVNTGSEGYVARFQGDTSAVDIFAGNTGTFTGGLITTATDIPLGFSTNAGTGSLIIATSGNVGIGLVPSYKLDVLNTTANVVLARFTTTATAAQSYGPAVVLTNDPNDTTRYFFAGTGGVTDRIKILSNGNIVNQNNSYTGISDEKLKENIVDAGSQWDDIKALRVRKYSFKEENASEPTQIGVIAQEVEAAGMSGLVYETADQDTAEDGSFVDTGEVTKTMKYSILYMKAVKALQEAMTRIETLEARITTLENA
jgi:hypothetical protein